MKLEKFVTVEDTPKEFFQFGEMLYPDAKVALKADEPVVSHHLEYNYIVYDKGRPLARASLYYNRVLVRATKYPIYLIGNYECVDNIDVSVFLLNSIEEDVRKRGGQMITGPINGSTLYDYRFNASNENVFYTEKKHKSYYTDQFLDFGYKKTTKYVSNLNTDVHTPYGNVKDRSAYFDDIGVTISTLNIDEWEHIVGGIYDIVIYTFVHKHRFAPYTKQEFFDRYDYLKYINTDMFYIAQDSDKKVVGYYLNHDNIYNTDEKSIVVSSIARHPDSKFKGLGYRMGYELHKYGVENNYSSYIHSFIHNESGSGKALSKNYRGRPFKHHYLFSKVL